MTEYENDLACYCGAPAAFFVTFYPAGSQYREVRPYCEEHALDSTHFANPPWKITAMGRYVAWLAVRQHEIREEAERVLASSQLALDV